MLLIDFGVVPFDSEDVLPLMWSGTLFKATTALPQSDTDEKAKFFKRQSLLAYGGRYDNLVAHY